MGEHSLRLSLRHSKAWKNWGSLAAQAETPEAYLLHNTCMRHLISFWSFLAPFRWVEKGHFLVFGESGAYILIAWQHQVWLRAHCACYVQRNMEHAFPVKSVGTYCKAWQFKVAYSVLEAGQALGYDTNWTADAFDQIEKYLWPRKILTIAGSWLQLKHYQQLWQYCVFSTYCESTLMPPVMHWRGKSWCSNTLRS